MRRVITLAKEKREKSKEIKHRFSALEVDYMSTSRSIQKACHMQSIKSGFWWVGSSDGKAIRQDWEPRNNVAEKIALIHSELSEALEAMRKEDTKSEDGKLTVRSDKKGLNMYAMAEELADTIIRVYDLAEFLQLEIGKAVITKMRYNQTRVRKHGKSF